MTDIEILEEISAEEFARAVKREVMQVDGQWVVRLLYEDSTIKYVRNLAIPTNPADDEEVWYWPEVDALRDTLHHLEGDLLQKNTRLIGSTQSLEIAARPDAAGEYEECSHTGNLRFIIDVVDPTMQAKYEKWKAESDCVLEIESMDEKIALLKDAVQDGNLSDYSLRVVAGIIVASDKVYTPEEIAKIREEIPEWVFERARHIHEPTIMEDNEPT